MMACAERKRAGRRRNPEVQPLYAIGRVLHYTGPVTAQRKRWEATVRLDCSGRPDLIEESGISVMRFSEDDLAAAGNWEREDLGPLLVFSRDYGKTWQLESLDDTKIEIGKAVKRVADEMATAIMSSSRDRLLFPEELDGVSVRWFRRARYGDVMAVNKVLDAALPDDAEPVDAKLFGVDVGQVSSEEAVPTYVVAERLCYVYGLDNSAECRHLMETIILKNISDRTDFWSNRFHVTAHGTSELFAQYLPPSPADTFIIAEVAKGYYVVSYDEEFFASFTELQNALDYVAAKMAEGEYGKLIASQELDPPPVVIADRKGEMSQVRLEEEKGRAVAEVLHTWKAQKS